VYFFLIFNSVIYMSPFFTSLAYIFIYFLLSSTMTGNTRLSPESASPCPNPALETVCTNQYHVE
jgi:hypothetical protein